MRVKTNITMFIIFVLISSGLIYLMCNLGNLSQSLYNMNKDFNEDYAFIYSPTTEQYLFSIYQDDDVNFYGNKMVEFDNTVYSVYLSSNKSDLYFQSYRWMKYSSNTEVEANTIYQHKQSIEGIIKKDLKQNALIFDNQNLDSFLYMFQDKNNFIEDDVMLIVIKKSSDSFRSFIEQFGYPSNTIPIDQSKFYVFGNVIYNQTIGIFKGFITFFYILYLMPVILIFFVFYYTYKIFLSNELKIMKIKNIFYLKKGKIWIQNFIFNLVMYLFAYLIVIGLFSIAFNLYLDTIKYLVIAFIIIVFVIAISSLKIVNVAIKNDLNTGGHDG